MTELWNKNRSSFKVNGHRVKHYEEGMQSEEKIEKGMELEKVVQHRAGRRLAKDSLERSACGRKPVN